ncbi:hypothetical protein [Stappia sp. ICDLI1TA098]
MTWLMTLGARLKGWALFVGAIAVAVASAYLAGRRSERADARAREARGRLEAMRSRKETDNEVDALGAADLDSRYREWLRDGDR